MTTKQSKSKHAATTKKTTPPVEPPKKKSKLKIVLFRLLGLSITIGLLYYIFGVKLADQVDYAEVWRTVQSLSTAQCAVLVLSGFLTVVAVGWTAATVLPGLSIARGTQASVVGQLTSVALPPPLDMVIRFTMYRSYGFSNDRSVIAVAIAGIARYFTVVAMPIIGLLAVLLAGQGNWGYFWWMAGLSMLFFTALWIMRRVLASAIFAAKTGKVIEKSANQALKLVRQTPSDSLADRVVAFGRNTQNVAFNNFRPIALSNIAWGFSCALVFVLSVRFVGISSDVFSNPYLLLITGVMLLISSIPITPGGIGVTEAVIMSVVHFPSSEVQTTFASALFLYRLATWLLPMPIGVIAYAWWRYQKGHNKLATSAGA